MIRLLGGWGGGNAIECRLIIQRRIDFNGPGERMIWIFERENIRDFRDEIFHAVKNIILIYISKEKLKYCNIIGKRAIYAP